jgi:cardiolipin synthase
MKLLIVNLLTLIRIIGTILLIPIYKYHGGIIAGIFSLICYLTDSIDGILARHFKVSTFLGALFDGVADKMFTIVNFIVVYLITPYAVIPIMFELLIVLIQFLKFNRNYNVKSNIIGKIKVWILAACLVLTFIASDITSATLLPLQLRSFIQSIPSNTLYLCLMLPAILIEFITFLSYIIEIFKPSKKTIDVSTRPAPKYVYKKGINYVKDIWLNPEFYYQHRNETNLKDLIKITKQK